MLPFGVDCGTRKYSSLPPCTCNEILLASRIGPAKVEIFASDEWIATTFSLRFFNPHAVMPTSLVFSGRLLIVFPFNIDLEKSRLYLGSHIYNIVNTVISFASHMAIRSHARIEPLQRF